ncbi:MAG: hypothetical protein LBL48_06055 [Azoarcus sp.]|jgi:hypothetical protein|nr:hypothetical protein [Azoarcus sp.]
MVRLRRTQWMNSRKTIQDLIAELQSFDPKLEVLLSVDNGRNSCPVTRIEDRGERCLIEFCSDQWLARVYPETGLPWASIPDWLAEGKKIPQLILDLQALDKPALAVEISVDEGRNRYPISFIQKRKGDYLRHCLLAFAPC